ncbi:MAG: MopE-related protein [Polyangiaceae bacterium]
MNTTNERLRVGLAAVVLCVAACGSDDTMEAGGLGGVGPTTSSGTLGEGGAGGAGATTTATATSSTNTSASSTSSGAACVDADGDGYGNDCTTGPDCDDSNPSIWQVLTGYLDNDGDGYDGTPLALCVGTTLPAGVGAEALDCDDDNPLVLPDAADLPDNGVDEDCSGGDLVADDGNGFFVDGTTGSDSNWGTKASPFKTIQYGVVSARADAARTNVYVAAGAYAGAVAYVQSPGVPTAVNVVGGYMPTVGWKRDPAQTTSITAAQFVVSNGGGKLLLDGLTVVGTTSNTNNPSVYGSGGALTLVDCDVSAASGVGVASSAAELVIIHSNIGSSGGVAVELHGTEALIVGSTISGSDGIGAREDSTLTVVDSNVSGSFAIETDHSHAYLVGNVITGGWAITATASRPNIINNTIAVTGRGLTSQLFTASVLINNDVATEDYPIGNNGSTAEAYYLNNNIRSGVGTIIWDLITVDDIASLNACMFAGCEGAGGNFSGDPKFQGAADFHLGTGSADIDVGIDPTSYLPHDLVWYAQRDRDGHLRGAAGGWDVGAFESP